MTIPELLAPIKERLDKATPGPYDARVREFSNLALCEVWTEMGWYQQLPRDYREPTTELFVNAPTDLRKLIEAVEVLTVALEDYLCPYCLDKNNYPRCLRYTSCKYLDKAKEILEGTINE